MPAREPGLPRFWGESWACRPPPSIYTMSRGSSIKPLSGLYRKSSALNFLDLGSDTSYNLDSRWLHRGSILGLVQAHCHDGQVSTHSE